MSMPRVAANWPAEQANDPATAAVPSRDAESESLGPGDPYARPDAVADPAPGAGELPGGIAAGRPAPAPQRTVEPVPATRRVRDSALAEPAPGSVAELRARLDRLPDGHPSSPYDDTGRPKLPPTRLRQLELGLPPRVSAYLDRFAFDPDDESDSAWTASERRPAAAAPAAQPAASTRTERPAADDNADGAPTASDAPATADASTAPPAGSPPVQESAGSAEPGEELAGTGAGAADPDAGTPGEAGRADGESAARPAGDDPPAQRLNGHGGAAARPEWQHPYAQPGEHDQRGNGAGPRRPGGITLAPWPAGDPQSPAERSNGHRRDANQARPGQADPVADRTRPRDSRGPEPAGLDQHQPGTERYRSPGQDATGPIFGEFSRPRLPAGRPDDRRTDGVRGAEHGHGERPPPVRPPAVRPAEVRPPAVSPPAVRPPAARPEAPPAPAGQHAGDPPVTRPPAGPRLRASVDEVPPEVRTLTDRILAAYRAAEGRNSFGDYGNSGLTPAMRRIAAQLPAGGLAPGSEACSLKTADRFAAKLARLVARQPGRSPEDIAAGIGDAIRYAFTFPAADYTEGTWLVHRKLKAQGFDLEVRRNRWDNPEYKGVLTRWRDPAHGLPFEIQFHTPESWAVVSQTHAAYVRITDPATLGAERVRLRARQIAAASAAKPPPGWRDIADFRAGPR